MRPDRRERCCGSSPSWVLVGARADVRLDARCAPSPGTRSCAPRCPTRRVRRRDAMQGTVDRRADVGDAARAARRAVARADRRAPRSGARASAARSCSARSSRRRCSTSSRCVILGVVMFATVGLFDGHEGALAAVRDRAARAARRRARRARRCCAPGSRRASARVHAIARPARDALRQVRAGLRVFRTPRLGAVAVVDAARRLGAAVARLLRAARGARARRPRRARRGRRGAVRRQRHRRRCRPRRRTSASSRPRASRC